MNRRPIAITPDDPRTRRLLTVLADYAASHEGRSPALRELGGLVPLSSTSVAAYRLERLAGHGLITLGGHGESRSARLTTAGRQLIGRAASSDEALLEACYEALPHGALRERIGERLGR